MTSKHDIFYKSSYKLSELGDKTVHLVVTSPYPMIEMWDKTFDCERFFSAKKYLQAYRCMHDELNKTWKECYRVLIPGGIACINIGDACRKLDKFHLWPNHVDITHYCADIGFDCLPSIHWRKPTNKPTKFMGSGMYPGAYVTLEEEYILLFRKGNNRDYSDEEKKRRRQSAFFWEERNVWFCDLWEVLGTPQRIDPKFEEVRDRNASFPLEIPLRLIRMFSIYGDTVLDPFWGTGTTTVAAIMEGRNSIGYEICDKFKLVFEDKIKEIKTIANESTSKRIKVHKEFMQDRTSKYENKNHGFKVTTKQEQEMLLYKIADIKDYTVTYEKANETKSIKS